MLFFSATASAQEEEGAGSPHDIIVLVRPAKGNVKGFDELKKALDAYLRGTSIEVRWADVKKLPSRQPIQESESRKLADEVNARAVMWLDIKRGTMFLIFEDNRGEEHTLSRYFDCISADFSACADPIASTVSSALSSWIGRAAQPPPESAPPAVDNELDPISLSNPPWEKPIPPPSFLLDGGYALSVIGQGMVAHGVHLGFRMIFKRNLCLGISTNVLSKSIFKGDEGEAEAAISRWPLRFMAGGLFNWYRWSLSVAMGLVLNVGTGASIDNDHVFIEKQGTEPGFTGALIIDYNVWNWLFLWLRGGFDVFGTDFRYEIEDTSGYYQGVFSIDRAQESFSLGVSLRWDLESKT